MGINRGTMRPGISWDDFRKLPPVGKPKKVPGPGDYATMSRGDPIALLFMDFAVGTTMFRQGVDWQVILILALAAIAGTYIFFLWATKAKRAQKDIDWWFRFRGIREYGWLAGKLLPETRVKISIPGWIHFVYYWTQLVIFFLGLWYLLVDRSMTVPMAAVFIAALFGYFVAYIWDCKEGHFD